MTQAAACRACSAPIAGGAPRCDRCGAMQSDAVTCPHCRAVAGASPDAEFGFRCDVCGGPRLSLALAAQGAEAAHLARAETARRARAKARALTAGAGVATAALLLVATLAALLGATTGTAVLLAAALASGLGAFSASRKAKAAGAAIAPAIEEAWQAAAARAVEGSAGPVTAKSLAGRLGVDEARAEELLAFLEVSDVVRGDARGGYVGRLRIGESVEAEAEALAELEAAEIAAARARR